MHRPITLTLPDELIAQLREHAHAERSTMSAFVATALAYALECPLPAKAKPGPTAATLTRTQAHVLAVMQDKMGDIDPSEPYQMTESAIAKAAGVIRIKRTMLELKAAGLAYDLGQRPPHEGSAVLAPCWSVRMPHNWRYEHVDTGLPYAPPLAHSNKADGDTQPPEHVIAMAAKAGFNVRTK